MIDDLPGQNKNKSARFIVKNYPAGRRPLRLANYL